MDSGGCFEVPFGIAVGVSLAVAAVVLVLV